MNDELIVAYCSSPTMQEYLPMAINSLLKHTPQVKIYVLIEADEDDRLVHPNVQIINYKKLDLKMDLSNPNFYKNKILPAGDLRLYFAQIFPDIPKLLYLDVDTIVKDDISSIFETDLTNMAVGMVQEKKPWTVKGVYIGRYCNSGVCLFNLDYIREHKLDEQMIELINGPRLNMPDQDIINYVCRDHIVFLDPKYNCSQHTNFNVPNQIIRHYTYRDKLWDHKNSAEWKEYYVERLTNE